MLNGKKRFRQITGKLEVIEGDATFNRMIEEDK